MSFSFKYKPIRLKSGQIIYRPLMPISLCGKERIDVIGMLDSGSDVTIIPEELAEVLDIEYSGINEISGIAGNSFKSKEGKLNIEFGKDRETYKFDIPVLVPIEKADVQIIIGRAGFFEQFKITFSEAEKKILFKKSFNPAF